MHILQFNRKTIVNVLNLYGELDKQPNTTLYKIQDKPTSSKEATV